MLPLRPTRQQLLDQPQRQRLPLALSIPAWSPAVPSLLHQRLQPQVQPRRQQLPLARYLPAWSQALPHLAPRIPFKHINLLINPFICIPPPEVDGPIKGSANTDP